MAIKELVHDEAVLSTPCEKATAEDAQVAQDLLDTMESLDEAACLHANQIGVTHNLFAYVDEKDVQHVMFNPVIKLGLAASNLWRTATTWNQIAQNAICFAKWIWIHLRRRFRHSME